MTDKALEAALPGEVEAVFIGGETQALIERLKASAAHCEMINAPYAASACREAAASLQAMQARAEKAEEDAKRWEGRFFKMDANFDRAIARAEKAERERDDIVQKYADVLDDFRRKTHRTEAAEARVKVLEEALQLAKATIKVWHGPNAWDIYDRASPEMATINTALKGGSNG